MQVVAGVAIGLGAFLVALGVYGIASELPDLWDPCREWGIGNQHSVTIAPGDECQARSGTSETKTGFLARLALVPGLTIACGILAIVGAWRRERPWLVAATVGMGAEAIFLFFGFSVFFLIAAGVAVAFGACAAGLKPRRRVEGPVARA